MVLSSEMLPLLPRTPLSSFEELVANSEALSVRFPTIQNRVLTIANKSADPEATSSQIFKDALQTRVILHRKVELLIEEFLDVKRTFGTAIEKNLYKIMTVQKFIQRLIVKRPLTFLSSSDYTVGRDGQEIQGAKQKWPLVGTETEQAPLLLKDYLSYDEIAISALIGVSSPTYFINSGSRYNASKQGEQGTYTERGVYVGLVGARFEIPNQMESRFLLADSKHCSPRRGYGYHNPPSTHDEAVLQMWARFYEIKDQKSEVYGFPVVDIPSRPTLRPDLYKRRIAVTVETFLLEAEERGKDAGMSVHAFIVGLGLGVWQYHSEQKTLYLDVIIEVIRRLNFSHVDVVEVSWVAQDYNGDTILIVPGVDAYKDVMVVFTKQDPAVKREGNRLLVASYAWDGNAFPGNEFWIGTLEASGDPAAVCCSTIGELQNPYINPFWNNIKTYDDRRMHL